MTIRTLTITRAEVDTPDDVPPFSGKFLIRGDTAKVITDRGSTLWTAVISDAVSTDKGRYRVTILDGRTVDIIDKGCGCGGR
jgi:hypothetical protein